MKNRNFIRITEGIRHIKRNIKCIIVPILWIVIVVACYMAVEPLLPQMDFIGITNVWSIMLTIVMVEILIIGEMGILILLGTPFEAKRIEEALIRIRMCDKEGNSPMLLSKERKENIVKYTFFTPVLSKEDFINRIPNLRAILKAEIEKDWITEGDDPRYVIVETVSAKKNFRT